MSISYEDGKITLLKTTKMHRSKKALVLWTSGFFYLWENTYNLIFQIVIHISIVLFTITTI